MAAAPPRDQPAETLPAPPAQATIEEEPPLRPVTPDFALDWAEEAGQEAELPGDLAQLAADRQLAESLAQPQAAEPVAVDGPAPWENVPAGAEVASTEASTAAAAGTGDTGVRELDMEVEEREPEPSFEGMLSSSTSAQPTDTGREPEMPTETLAELYRTQGFYDRAAEVYRALLEERPGDPELEARLRAVESPEAEPAAPAAAPVDSVSERSSDEEDRESWLAGVASAWTSPEPESAGGPGLYSWSDDTQAETDAGGPTLSDYLGAVLAWRPTSAPTPPEPAPAKPVVVVQHQESLLATEDSVITDAEVTVALVDWEPPLAEPESAAVEASEPISAETDASIPESVSGDVQVPLAVEPHASMAEPSTGEPGQEAALQGQSGASPVEAAFEEWFEPESAAAALPPEPSRSGGTGAGVEAAPAAADSAPVPRSDTVEVDESDDDLEMFRSWLQSLKR